MRRPSRPVSLVLRTAFMRRVVVGGALLLAPGGVAALGGCEVPTPLAPAEPIGTFPAWGAEFATPAQQPQSALGAGMGGAPGAATSSTGQAMPGAIKSFSDGDAGLGKGVYQALCARCHGAAGEGGALPGNVAVPALADAGLQGRLDDASMARSIALGKGAMPSFRTELNRDQLAGVIAYVRTLKR